MAKKTAKPRGVDLFTFLNDITQGKRGDLLNDQTKSKFSPFMLVRFLSMSDRLLPIADFVNQYQMSLSQEQLYALLIGIVPKHRGFLRYIGPKNANIARNEITERLAKLLNVSRVDADEYVALLSDDVKESFMNSFGGKIDG